MIATTTLGAYPKPDYVPITDWFTTDYGDSTVDFTTAYEDQLRRAGDGAEMLFRRATAEVIADQIDAGIDVVTDGEVRRENYIHHQCRSFSGFDFGRLASRDMRGTVTTLLPRITGRVRFTESTLARDFTTAQSLSSRPVKVTVPGPMTIIDSTVDAFYDDDRSLGADLAAALSDQIGELVDAGCRNVQIDEPVMARRPDVALEYGIDQLVRCFDGAPEGITRTVHCCCGYPRRLDDVDYPKADRAAYVRLAPALDSAAIDQVSIEDAHRHNELGELLLLFSETTVILGVIAIASSRVETVDEVVRRLEEARRFLPADRLMAAPDCGLGYLPADLARRKLSVMTRAASQV